MILDCKHVVSILISAEFLGISHLVELCLEFIASNTNEVIRLPIDFGCINDRLLDRLASKISLQNLADLSDKKDKIASKLYQRRVEQFLEIKSRSFLMCTCCRKIFIEEQSD